ncbi:MAG: VWA domain-containing protein [Planctomycetota bacterium]
MNLATHFAWPAMLVALLMLPVLWWLLRRCFVRHEVELKAQLVSPARLIPGYVDLQAKRRLARRLFLLAMGFALLALAQPQWGRSADGLEPRGVDVVICLDLSRSMLARDLVPSRLERARQEVKAMSRRTRGDRVAVVAFAGDAMLAVPLTRDMEALRNVVDWLDPNLMLSSGTNVASAITLALGTLKTGDGDHQAIVVLSDGEDPGAQALDLAERCREQGVSLHALGFGTKSGAKIPILVDRGEGLELEETYLVDGEGKEVVTALDETGLRSLAKAGGGRFSTLEGAKAPLARLFDTELSWRAHRSHARSLDQSKANRFQWPLLVALLLFAADLALTTAGRRR